MINVESEKRVSGVVKSLIEIAKRLWEIELGGKENLETARQHLQEGSLMVIFNHSFSGDVFCGGAVSWETFQDEVKHLIVPAGKKHLHLTRALGNLILGNLWPKADMKRTEALKIVRDAIAIRVLAQLIKAELVPIVQSYDLDYYGSKVALRTWKHLLRRGEEVAQKPGTVVIYAPEGRRSDNRELQKIERGIVDFLERAGDNCLCLPLGIILEEGNRGLNLGKRVRVEAGPPFGLNDLTSDKRRPLPKQEKIRIANRIMAKYIAPLLPEEYHGVYQDFPSLPVRHTSDDPGSSEF